MKYHYTYRITNIRENKHYYGSRSSNKLPSEDIGIYYFSSSSDKEFIKDQKENPKNYKYKIVYIFPSRKLATSLEIKLHNRFNVGINESFYNRSKQTSNRFDRTGIYHSEETKEKISRNNKGKNLGFIHSEETKDKLRKHHANFKGNNNPFYGKKHSEESLNKMKLWVPSIETRLNMRNAQKGKIINENQRNALLISAKLKPSKETKEKMRLAQQKAKYKRIKPITIYNEKSESVLSIITFHREELINLGFPTALIKTSTDNTKMYEKFSRECDRTRIINLGFIKFKGWYAKRVTLTK